MYQVSHRVNGASYCVFTWIDPKRDGYGGDVLEGVSLEYPEEVHAWPEGSAPPDPCVGVRDRTHFRVFRNEALLRQAGYDLVEGIPVVLKRWSEFLRLTEPASLDEEEWFDFLDFTDESAKLRRTRPQAVDSPTSGSRDDVAAWIAKQHFIVDSGIREVWYLPQRAPADEIRLLEVNDRFVVNENSVDLLDFGLDVEGAPFRLVVADVSSGQLDGIRRDQSQLPAGWSLEGAQIWRRRGA